MATSPRLGGRLPRSLALFAALAITTGWAPVEPRAGGTPASAIATRSERAAPATAATVASAQRVAIAAARHEALQSMAWAARPVFGSETASAHRHARWTEPVAEKAAPKERVKTKPAPVKSAPATAAPTSHKQTYQGTNHFWIPSLGMSYGVRSYACGRTSTPGNHIYRWGCAGRNNVYLLGHAWGVMKPLHDLYVRGGLRRGMVAVFADGAGHVRKYKVTEWRVVVPTEVAWQIAAQPVPSMTLQTCIGKYSQYRLNVRLVAVR